MAKYIIENGLMKEVQDSTTPTQAPTTLSNKALVTPYNFTDANAAAQAAGTQLAPKTAETIQIVQTPEYTRQFGDYAGNLVELMGQIFTESQIPIALANKLIYLKGFRIDIKIDDSGSMNTPTNNGKTRWQNTYDRLVLLMKLLQLVPTGTVRISFLDRWASIKIKRNRRGGMTPAQFYREAVAFLDGQFAVAPNGGTPIWRSVDSMIRYARKKPTASYLVTDGRPSSDDFESEQEEIEATKNLILNRRNKRYNPFTFMCCSDIPTDTLWMHEIEEIACRPGTLGFVSALQNFIAERIEVLNDQGAWFPYSQAVWLICNLVAALNPYDLDALDQHEPLTKATLDNTFLGYISTDATYEGYFVQHPNATWAFKEDYELFKTKEFAYMIDSVRDFATILADKLNTDINNRQTSTEFQALAYTEWQLMGRYGRHRSNDLWQARQNFLVYNCLNMEQQQLNTAIANNIMMTQHLWADYIYSVKITNAWQQYLNAFHNEFGAAAPPSYQAATQIPGSDSFSQPGYQHYYAAASTSYNSSSATMFQPQAKQLSRSQFQSALRSQPINILQQQFLPQDLPPDFERSSTMCVVF